MRRLIRFVLLLLALTAMCAAQPQPLSPALKDAAGDWQVIDDHGKPGGHVETYVANGELFGKVTQSRPERPPDEPCMRCPGELRNKPVLGMVIIRGFHPDGNVWVGGTVLDPKTGRIYRGKIWAMGRDKLRLRGFVGISLFGRSETWTRLH